MTNFYVSDYYYFQKGDEVKSSVNIDPNKIRRLHNTDKISLKLATELVRKSDVDFIIYSSRHGQIVNSTEIVKKIISRDEVSPAIFSISVHNAPVGMLTILENLHIPHTAISAAEDSFLTGLTLSGIKTDHYKKILYIYTEYNLPEFYKDVDTDSPDLSFMALISKNELNHNLDVSIIESIKANCMSIRDQISQVVANIEVPQ